MLVLVWHLLCILQFWMREIDWHGLGGRSEYSVIIRCSNYKGIVDLHRMALWIVLVIHRVMMFIRMYDILTRNYGVHVYIHRCADLPFLSIPTHVAVVVVSKNLLLTNMSIHVKNAIGLIKVPIHVKDDVGGNVLESALAFQTNDCLVEEPKKHDVANEDQQQNKHRNYMNFMMHSRALPKDDERRV